MSRIVKAMLVSLLLAATSAAQDSWMWGRGRRYPPRLPNAQSFDGGFNFCRLMYQSIRREAGGQGWSTDYPDADINFSTRFSELTRGRISRSTGGQPNHLVVRATDEFLFQCPFLLASDVGTMTLDDQQAARLREYLLKGGFLWVDDFWGPWAWAAWTAEISKVLPSAEYPIREIPPEHPVNRTMFEVVELPQIPSIQFWRTSGGHTSERGFDSAVPTMKAITDARGRVMVLMTHNTDISDAWEREGEDPQFFYSFSPQGYAVGLNVILYAMSH